MKFSRFVVIASVFVFAVPLGAQQDAGASLTISFMNGTTSFHVGEVIPVELSFRAYIPDLYTLDTRNYDRSGRLDVEQFHVSPPGRDPLENYYSNGTFIGGGLGGEIILSNRPYVMREDLNEWVALDKPGHYSLYVTSGRVSRQGETALERVKLQSNALEFDVVAADQAWKQQTLSWAMSTLSMESSTKKDKIAAVRTLRFLDTPESAQALVDLLSEPSDGDEWDEIAGLASSPYQSLVVRELDRGMADPNTALTMDYLYILTKLKFQLERKALPHYPQGDPQAQAKWLEQRQTWNKEFSQLQDALYRKAATLVFSKSGLARAETVKAVIQNASQKPDRIGALAEVPPEAIASAFLNLPEDAQWDLLTSSWERMKIPEMVAPLEQVAQQSDMKNAMLRDLVFRCLYDLDPSEARPIFLEEMRHPHVDGERYTVKGGTLGLLPDKTLPQMDDMLAARLAIKNNPTIDLDAQLTGRYATKAILAKVKRIYENAPGEWDCVTEDGFVLYFLRVDADYGVEQLATAPSACMTNSLPAVVRMKRWNEVEPGIIARLNGPDLWRANQAAEALAKYGDAEAEKAIWERLERFHAQWAGRADELTVYRPGMKKDAREAMELEGGLIEALGTAQAWLLTNDQVGALANLTSGQERANVKRWHWSSPVDLDVAFFRGQMQATVHQYSATGMASLLSKLEQYPAETEFLLNISGPQDKVGRTVTALDDAASEHGLQIELVKPMPTN